MSGLVPVTCAPVFAPEASPIELPEGLSLAEIVAIAMPDLAERDWGELRVVLEHAGEMVAVPQPMWPRVRPKAGVKTLIRIRPGGDSNILRNVLIAVVSVAAMAVGAWAAPLIVPAVGLGQSLVQGGIVAALSIGGSLAIQALIPPSTPKEERRRPSYTINGWQNDIRRGAPVPLALGKIRMAPVFAAEPFIEIVDGKQYVRALFTFGYGPLDISDIRIGDTPLSKYKNVRTEMREGWEDDDPITIVRNQVITDPNSSVELVKPWPRNAAGEVIDGSSAIATPVVRFSASDARKASVIIAFQSGLFRVNDKGNLKSQTVNIRIRQRPKGASTWQDVKTLEVTGKRRDPIFRQYTWTLPSRGTWEIEIQRMTPESTDNQVSDRSHLVALQSFRPEYPINLGKPLSLLAVRIMATHQLSGMLGNVNALVQRYGPVWDGETWSTGLTRNPASAYRTLLQSAASPYPVPDSEIDLDWVQSFWEFCDAKGLRYNRVHEAEETLGDALSMVCGAGRAMWRHDGLRWTGFIDRPDSLTIDHISPRNSGGFTWSRAYSDPPDGLRVSFRDETNGYTPSERTVPWIGFEGDPELTEVLELPGKTDPDEIWIEARRRMHEIEKRPDTFTTRQDGIARQYTRGDQIIGSYDVLDHVQQAARVTQITGALVVLDETIEMAPDTPWAIRFFSYADDTDAIGTSVVREVAYSATPTSALRVLNPDLMPAVGELVHMGPMASTGLAMKVRGVERGEGGGSVLRLVAAAPEIDALTDAEVPPAWSPRVGAEIFPDPVPLDPPVFVAIEHGLVGTDDPDGLRVLFAEGESLEPTVSVRVDHRLSGASVYDGTTVPASDGTADIAGYSAGNAVELRLVAIASDATESVPTAATVVVIGADDAAIPSALEEASIIVAGGLGNAQVTFVTGPDTATAKVQLYRVPAGDTLDRDVHAVGAPIAVSTGATYTHVDGDGTRADLIANGGFGSATDWTLGENWSIGSGVASHATGAADTIRQALALTAGETYRGAVTLSGATAGDLTPTLVGGADQTDTAIAANGAGYFEIAAVTGNTDFGFTASSDFDGSIDDVIVFLATTSCIDQGTYDYYLEPQNSLGGAGPITSAFTVNII